MDGMTFREAMVKTVEMSKRDGCRYMLYRDRDGRWLVSRKYWDDWFFRAYPGGRKQMSVLGKDNMAMPELRDGEPCGHPGCLSHVTHPCEGCGRVAGRRGRAIGGLDKKTS